MCLNLLLAEPYSNSMRSFGLPTDPIRRFRIRCLQLFNEDVLMDPRLQNNKVLLSDVMTARMATVNAAIMMVSSFLASLINTTSIKLDFLQTELG